MDKLSYTGFASSAYRESDFSSGMPSAFLEGGCAKCTINVVSCSQAPLSGLFEVAPRVYVVSLPRHYSSKLHE